MNALLPIISAFLQAGWYTIDKTVLSMRRITYRSYLGASFPLLFIITLIIFAVIQPPFSRALFNQTSLLLLGTSIIITLVANLLFYQALDGDKLEEIDVIDLMSNLPTILYSSLMFTEERKPWVIALALITVGVVVWSHWEHHHFRIAKHTLPYLLFVVTIYPWYGPLSKILLETWHPVTLSLIRYGVIAAIVGPMFYQSARRIPRKAVGLFILSNAFGAVSWIITYTSYAHLGVVYTTLVLMLSPLLTYAAAVIFLKEPIHMKKTIAFAIVLTAIVAAQIMG